jgi:NADPH:quinone reductase-like Zn-dependent oxidoreductase
MLGGNELICSAQLTPDYMKKLGVQLTGEKAVIPGADYAGVIHSVGKNSKWTVGQEVHGMNMDITGGKSINTDTNKHGG